MHLNKSTRTKSGRLELEQFRGGSLAIWSKGRRSDTYPIIYQPEYGGRRVKQQQVKSHFLLVKYIVLLAQSHIERDCFSWHLLHTFSFIHKSWYFFFLPLHQPIFKDYLKHLACALISRLIAVSQVINNLLISTIDGSFNHQKKNLNFWLTIDQSSYHSILLHSNIFYSLFIIEKSYEDLNWNVSNDFWYVNDRMHTLDCEFFQSIKITFYYFHISFYLVINLWSKSKVI